MNIHVRAAIIIVASVATGFNVTAAEIDPIDVQLRTDLQALQAAFDRNVQAKKAEAVRKYEARLEEAQRARKTDLANEIAAKIAALKNEPAPKPLAPPPPSAGELRVLGKWVLENAKGGAMGDMIIEKAGDELYKLTRIGGGAFAVNGTYKLEGDKFVKVAQPGVPDADLEWRITGTKLRLTAGQYKDWVLRRAK